MRTLPDLIEPRQKILFVGTNPGAKSALIGHYFAGASNMFWKLLHESELTTERLTTYLDYKVKKYGYGLTDVIKRPTRSTTELRKRDARGARRRLDNIVEENKPRIVAFIGKAGYRYYLDENNVPLDYGMQKREISKSVVFLLPSTSGASFADTKYDEKLFWYSNLRKTSSGFNR